MSSVISKTTINRLLKDIKNIIKNPLTDQGIYYSHDDTDMLKGYAMIIGPSDTPYFGGYYFFEIIYPYDYPYSPPVVKYCTNGDNIRFNPNLYVCGKVCISLLNTWEGEQWTSCQTISTVLLTLCTLLCSNPLLNEPKVTIHNKDVNKYNKIIEFANLDIAVCAIVNKKKGVYQPFFELFYPFIKETFNANFDKLYEFAQKKKESDVNHKRISTGYYDMVVYINYEYILNKLNETKELIQVL